MDKNTTIPQDKALEIRKVALVKKYTKIATITAVCISLFSFAFVAGYVGTFLLFQ